MEDFAKFSGLKCNYDKTEILRIGSLRNSDASFYSEFPLQWSDGPVKVLGVLTTSSVAEMAEINYEAMLKKIANICKIWGTRSLTLLGKIQIVNTLIIPHMIYRLQVLPSPEVQFYKEFEQLIRSFLWDGHRGKIAYKKLIQSYKRGGLKLADLKTKDTALKIKLVQVDCFSNTLLSELLTQGIPLDKEHRWDCNISAKDICSLVKKELKLIKDIFSAWAKYKPSQPNLCIKSLINVYGLTLG